MVARRADLASWKQRMRLRGMGFLFAPAPWGADSLRQHCGFLFGIVRLERTLFAEDKGDTLLKGVKFIAGRGVFPTQKQ